MKKILFTLFVIGCIANINAQADAFITTWVTSTGFETINLSVQTNADNYTIDWGDGSTDTYTATEVPEHLYINSGEHTVSFMGTFTQLILEGHTKLQAVQQWGNRKWTSMEKMFKDCTNLNSIPSQAPDLSLCTNMNSMFSGASQFNQNIGSWDVSNVTDMTNMLNGVQLSTTNYDALLIAWAALPLQPNINFNAGNSKYFDGETARASINDNFGWNITDGGLDSDSLIVLGSNGITIEYMRESVPSPYFIKANPRGNGMEWFAVVDNSSKNEISDYANKLSRGTGVGASYFWPPGERTPIPLNNIVTTLVTDMGSLFAAKTGWNEPIDSWDVSNVTNMSSMFELARAFNQPIDSWDVSNVTNMSRMFMSASSFNEPLDSWDVSSVTDMSGMFMYAGFNKPLNSWDVSNVTDMTNMFNDADSFNQSLNSWDVSNVINMSGMFRHNQAFNQPLDSWDVSNVINMSEMFRQAFVFNQPLNSWDVSNVTNMGGMFSSAKTFNQPLNSWDVSNVTNMGGMFSSAETFNQPLNSWDVSNVTNMGGMFSSAKTFNQPLNSWDVSNVTNMSGMFGSEYNTIVFDQPLNSWDVSNVINMSGMFWRAELFNQPLNEWDVSSVTDMGNMFRGSFNGNTTFNQPLDSWDTSNVTNMGGMFQLATSFDQPLNSWDVSSVTNMGGMFSSAKTFNQPLNSWDVGSVTNMSYMFSYANTFNQTLDSWNVGGVTDMTNMFNGIQLSTDNYDATLIGWATRGANGTLNSNVNFHGGNSKYCNGLGARNYLINTYGWSITDGGSDCSSLNTEEFDITGLKLYPNPVISILNVDNNLTNQPYNIIDTLGKVILKGNLNEGNNSINVEKLSKGIYYLKVLDKRARSFIKE
jgi:surface protein